MDMRKLNVCLFILVCSSVVTLLFSPPLHSEIYKYVDKNGTIHFVDDVGKIPAEYRDQVTVYKDKSKATSEEGAPTASEVETPAFSEEEGQASDDSTQQMKELLEEEKRQQEEKAREELEQSLTTKVTISGNHVLVPVTLGYGGREVQATLVLDTGADLITVHRQIADQLRLPLTKRAGVQVTGGKTIRARLAELDYVRVGPYEAKKAQVLIILDQGSPTPHDGLLGMNFLRGTEYSIDFENQVIRWKP
jgi:predicted aspartyl protease